MTAGRVIVQARPARTPAVPPQQIRGHPALVEKHILTGIVHGQPRAPLPPLRRDVSAPLFVRVYGFF